MPRRHRSFLAGILAATFALFLAVPPPPAAAQAKPRPIGSFTDWEAFTYGDGQNRTCYVVSRPKSTEPEGVRRGDIYTMISHRPADKVRNEVSIYGGYPFRKDTPVQVAVGSNRFELVTFAEGGYEETAWAPDADADQRLVEAMKRGYTMTVVGVSERGTRTTDTYSLSGVTAALRTIDEACK